jgi:DNA polymerase-3 subunit epsilon
MAILFVDTETSDMIKRGRGPGPHQPHIVQLAALLVEEGSETPMSTLIRPDGWTISAGAQKVHGISTARAQAEGIPLQKAISLFHKMAARADMLVAHNIDFDRIMILSEYSRLGMEHPFEEKREFCTMRAASNIIKIPGPYGYKWPTLQEAYRYFTGKDLNSAHDALADVRACRVVYEALVKTR